MPRSRASRSFPTSTRGALLTGGSAVLAVAMVTTALVSGPDGRAAPGGQTRAVRVAAAPDAGPAGAARPGWKLVAWDGFTNARDTRRNWEYYNGPGHDGKGRRSPSAISVRNGRLRLTGKANGTTGGMGWKHGTAKFGRWEARVRMNRACACYHPIFLLWPVNGGGGTDPKFGGGEVDWMEVINDRGKRDLANFYLHYGPRDNHQKMTGGVRRDMRKWHTFAIEWTPRSITAFVDGRRWFRSTDRRTLPPGRMAATIQLDWLPEYIPRTLPGIDRRRPAWMEVEWIRRYVRR